MIQPYLMSVYRDGGRGEAVSGRLAFDCWGLVRAVRNELFGLPLLPSYGAISPDDKRGLTDAYQAEVDAFAEGKPVPGAIATVWKFRLCVHVGVCVEVNGRLGVLETGRKIGCRWLSIADFESKYMTVRYYS
ncbi:phage tail protein [Halomonas litopenaei]|uniref:phage tail protein n=1 Tax=Halomonas litopenaei TaxID=2109328 RepID=UPI001A8F3370|nr:phage tail protein [Halomonas litopenaei]MBN8410685.1 hypothetical protein [Halomonas litopenaei]